MTNGFFGFFGLGLQDFSPPIPRCLLDAARSKNEIESQAGAFRSFPGKKLQGKASLFPSAP